MSMLQLKLRNPMNGLDKSNVSLVRSQKLHNWVKSFLRKNIFISLAFVFFSFTKGQEISEAIF